MVDFKVLLIKMVKKLAGESNLIANIEKIGDHFYHKNTTQELCKFNNLTFEQVIDKNPYDIHPLDIANERHKLYQQAWDGEEVLVKVDRACYSDSPAYAVLTPVFYKGRVICITLQVIPCDLIPLQLRGIA